MDKQERANRIIAKGEFSNHSHVVTGDAKVKRNSNGEILIELGNEEAVLKHLLESEWMDGRETWTGEHRDINLTGLDRATEIGGFLGRHGDVALKKIAERTYKYVQQVVFDPLTKRIEQARD